MSDRMTRIIVWFAVVPAALIVIIGVVDLVVESPDAGVSAIAETKQVSASAIVGRGAEAKSDRSQDYVKLGFEPFARDGHRST